MKKSVSLLVEQLNDINNTLVNSYSKGKTTPKKTTNELLKAKMYIFKNLCHDTTILNEYIDSALYYLQDNLINECVFSIDELINYIIFLNDIETMF